MDDLTPAERKQHMVSIKKRFGALNGASARAMWEYGSLFREVSANELWRDDGRAGRRAELVRPVDVGANRDSGARPHRTAVQSFARTRFRRRPTRSERFLRVAPASGLTFTELDQVAAWWWDRRFPGRLLGDAGEGA